MKSKVFEIHKIKQISDMISVWVGILSLIAGGIWGIFEYLDRKQQGRVAETLAYVDRYNDSPMYGARKRIEMIWFEKGDEAKKVLLFGDAKKWTEFVLKLVSAHRLRSDILTMLEFYELIAVCTKEKICDTNTAYSFFGPQALSFKNQHIRYIKWLRGDLRDESIGRELQRFANNYRKFRTTPGTLPKF